jgi:hypothetical protein
MIVDDASEQRQQVLTYMRTAGQVVTPKEIAIALNRPRASVRRLMRKMAEDNDLDLIAYGMYTLPGRARK